MGNKKNRFYIISSVFGTASLLFCLLILLVHDAFIKTASREESLKTRVLSLTERAYDTVFFALSRPYTAGQVIANDTFLIDSLAAEPQFSEQELAAKIGPYLASLQERFGYRATGVVSAQTRRFYLSDGSVRGISPEVDARDVWYDDFLQDGKDFRLSFFSEPGGIWSADFTAAIKNSSGGYLGAYTVSFDVTELLNSIGQLEQENGITITLVDGPGLVQLATDFRAVRNSRFTESRFDSIEGPVVYRIQGDSFTVMRSLGFLDWNLVVHSAEQRSSESGRERHVLMLQILLLVIAILLLCILGFVLLKKDAGLSRFDRLTGLANRNYFKEIFGEQGVFNTTRYHSLAVLDIDKFKSVNDRRDGDQIILKVVAIAKELLDGKGQMLRWGGDEFVILLEPDSDVSCALCESLCEKVKNALGVTVSIGLAQIRISDTIKKNYYRAVQACYVVKELGGNGVKKC